MRNIFIIQIKNNNTIKALFTGYDLDKDYKITEHDDIYKAVNAYGNEIKENTDIIVVSDGFNSNKKDSIVLAFNKYNIQTKPFYLDYREAFINYNILFTKLSNYKHVGILFQREDNLVFFHATIDNNGELKAEVKDYIFENHDYNNLTLEEKDDKLFSILPKVFENKIDVLYLTTKTFSGGYMKKSLELMCNNRRVFLEENLLILGGYAYLKNYYTQSKKINIKSRYTSPVKISIDAKIKSKYKRINLVDYNTRTYNEINPIELVTFNEEKIKFYIEGKINLDVDLCIFHLVRGNDKPTRLRVRIEFIDNSNMFSISVQDIGFGTFVKPTYMQVKKYVSLENRG